MHQPDDVKSLRRARGGSRVAALAFDLICRHGPLPRSTLRRTLQASPVTVTSAVQELVARGLVVEGDEKIPTRGRHAGLLDVAPTVGGVIAADIGAVNLRLAAADLRGRIIERQRIETPASPDRRQLQRLFQSVRKHLDGPVHAVGIGIAGTVHDDGSLSIADSIKGWRDVDFVEWLSPLEAPLLIDNESNLAALGEFHHGDVGDVRNMVSVSLGAGTGAGLVLEGRLYRGADGLAGEFGDLRTNLDPGMHLEAKAGAAGLVARYRRHGGKGNSLDPEVIFKRAAAGEAAASKALQETAEELAVALLNTTVLLNPDVIVIGGGMAAAGEALLGPIRELMRPLAQPMPDIRASVLGADATLVGAAAWAAETSRAAVVAMIDKTAFIEDDQQTPETSAAVLGQPA